MLLYTAQGIIIRELHRLTELSMKGQAWQLSKCTCPWLIMWNG